MNKFKIPLRKQSEIPNVATDVRYDIQIAFYKSRLFHQDPSNILNIEVIF